jgi:hypothetical protein
MPFLSVYPVQEQHQEESGDVYNEIACVSLRLWTANAQARLGQ